MNKEPLGLYIFRYVVGLGIVVFMCMLYWSSVLVEDRLGNIQTGMTQMHAELDQLRNESKAIREEVRHAAPRIQESGSGSPQLPFQEAERGVQRPHIDPSLPNLLKTDPFYAETLPQLLGPGFIPHGTFRGATIAKPDHLHPFSNWLEVATWLRWCNASVAQLQFGKYETFSPNMAIKVEARKRKDIDVPEFWVHLRDDVYWQPLSPHFFRNIELAPHFLRKHQVTASDYLLFFNALMNPYNQEPGAVAARTRLKDIEEIEVIDPLTFVVRWKAQEVVDENGQSVPKIQYVAKELTGGLQPLASFVYQYFPDGRKIIDDGSDPGVYRTNSVWAQNFSQHWAKNIIVSCGAWVFDGMTDEGITFRRNPNFYFPLAALGVSRKVQFKNTTDAVWQAFKAGNLDAYALQPDQLIEWEDFQESNRYRQQVERGNAIKRLDYLSMSFAYVGWNEATPFFNSQRVRQAMTMAIDRKRIINQYLNGMGIEITGSFSPFSSAYDQAITPWPFDKQRAVELLEEEGWYDSDGDGVIDKVIEGERVPFQFRLTYFVKSPTAKAICDYIATTLKEIGVQCRLNGVDVADLSAAFDAKSFDAILLAWALATPPEDPRQLWYSKGAKEPGSSNMVGFENAEADEIIDKLTFEDNPQRREELYHRFHAIIHEEQPYTFLYAPKTALLYREYLQNVFIPAERQDLIPGADIAEPLSAAFWIEDES